MGPGQPCLMICGRGNKKGAPKMMPVPQWDKLQAPRKKIGFTFQRANFRSL
jgi:hypothetical protein